MARLNGLLAERLGYVDPAGAVQKHCKGSPIWRALHTPGGPQVVRVIDETDVFRLIMRSQLPSAERFSDWVFEEVLPSIRRTGSYVGRPPVEETDDALLARAVVRANALLAEKDRAIAERDGRIGVLTVEVGQQTRRALKAEADGAVVPALGHPRGAALHPADRRLPREPPATAPRILGEGGSRGKPCPPRPQSPAGSAA